MTQPSPTFEELVAYVSGELSAVDAATLERQIGSSVDDQRLTRRLQDVIESIAAMEDAPAGAVARAAVLLGSVRPAPATGPGQAQAQGQAQGQGWLDRAAQFVADLIFDSRRQPALAGFRHVATAVQLAFEWPGGRIDIHIEGAVAGNGRPRQLRGQIVADDGSRFGKVMLLPAGGGDACSSTQIDQHGRFKLESPPGHYELAVEVGDGVRGLRVEPLEVP